MKKFTRTLFAYILLRMAHAVLRKYKPTVVMVTGSVGKTSTKDAIAAVLAERFYVRASEKSYNSEFGVPLTILGAKNPWAHPTYWIKTFIEGLSIMWLPNHYPKLLVLEVGADRPGDLAQILHIATPDVVVVTRLPKVPVHVEAYATPDAVREEEFAPAYALKPGDSLIVSSDDEYATALAKPLEVSLTMYGVHSGADVQVCDEHVYDVDGQPVGMACTLVVAGMSYPIMIAGALGRPQLLAPAAAVAAGLSLGMSVEQCMRGLKNYAPPPGRGCIIRGINQSTLIDDSYNASPAAVEEALVSLNLLANSVPDARRIAVIGDMLELGRYSLVEHEAIGKSAANKCDILVTVGPRAKTIADSARAEGMSEDVTFSFDTASDAALFLQGLVVAHDIVLIKGSQSIRTERIVEALLADQADRKLLVRQDVEWRKI
jgi:UDP-N-acetylmuramyl pentapeptide synthase